jgi:hypothetical protein
MQAHYTRLFTDDQGDSCFEELAIELQPGGFSADGVEALPWAPFLANEGTFWIGGSTTWKGESPHPAPQRFIGVTVQGEYEVTTSKGVTRRFPRGSVLLVEDTTGAGHSTKVISAEDVTGSCVALPAKAPI